MDGRVTSVEARGLVWRIGTMSLAQIDEIRSLLGLLARCPPTHWSRFERDLFGRIARELLRTHHPKVTNAQASELFEPEQIEALMAEASRQILLADNLAGRTALRSADSRIVTI
jgi:hypothetical protein